MNGAGLRAPKLLTMRPRSSEWAASKFTFASTRQPDSFSGRCCMTEQTPPSQNPPERQKLTFFFEKTGSFQTLHADGAFGNLTPNGQVFLAFYVERSPIPKTMVCEIGTDGSISNPQFSGKQGIYREVQTGILMSPSVLSDLVNHIEQLQQRLKALQKNDGPVS